jgi:hypothetical protein
MHRLECLSNKDIHNVAYDKGRMPWSPPRRVACAGRQPGAPKPRARPAATRPSQTACAGSQGGGFRSTQIDGREVHSMEERSPRRQKTGQRAGRGSTRRTPEARRSGGPLWLRRGPPEQDRRPLRPGLSWARRGVRRDLAPPIGRGSGSCSAEVLDEASLTEPAIQARGRISGAHRERWLGYPGGWGPCVPPVVKRQG